MLPKFKPTGFFSSALVVVFAAALIAIIASYVRESALLKEAHITAIEMEQVSFARFQVEENISKVIKETLESELSKNNTDSVILNSIVSKKVSEVYERFKKHFVCEPYITDGTSKYPFTSLNELSRTIVFESDGITIAEYTYTGGTMKNKSVVCKIQKGSAYAFASLVPGYTVRATKVG